MSKPIVSVSESKLRLYLDAEILVHYVLRKIDRSKARKCQKLLSTIQKGDYEGVVSLLALMECTKVVRELAAEMMICRPSDWKEMIGKSVKALMEINNLTFVEGSPEERVASAKIKDLLYGNLSWQAYAIIEKYSGKCVPNPSDRTSAKHDGLSPCDCLHICIAKAMDCDQMATFDRDFKESKAEITPYFVQDNVY
jgi:predicted nucleic acid-binding protein